MHRGNQMSDFPHANQRLGDRCTAVGMGADNHWPLDVRDNRSNDLCIVIQIPQLGGFMATARQSDRADVDAAEPLDHEVPTPGTVPSPVH
jgi:hypothetical protein